MFVVWATLPGAATLRQPVVTLASGLTASVPSGLVPTRRL
jgi:hypothetical protein